MSRVGRNNVITTLTIVKSSQLRRSRARLSTALLAMCVALAIYATPAEARFAHTISEAQAIAVADRFGAAAYEQYGWTQGWWRECARQTPWTFSCSIEIYSEEQGGPYCWREFEVASSIWTGRLRTEGWEPWACDPWPTEEAP
jgi:hypothetical protein